MADYRNSVSSNHSGNYFQEIQQLNTLRKMADSGPNASTGDLLRQLDSEARKSGFEPVGALYTGVTADLFFGNNSRVMELEGKLAEQIGPHNVTEVFDLLKHMDTYIPTRTVINAFYAGFQKLFSRQAATQEKSGPDPAELASQPSPFNQTLADE
ncbi:MAG TPA: hypothetical protein V6C52_11335 [Coleofasciculaceae cyanobacterium]|jgi:hypothetical protein